MNNQRFIDLVAVLVITSVIALNVLTSTKNLTAINALKKELAEIKLLIEECEKELPRNQHCVLITVPETTNE